MIFVMSDIHGQYKKFMTMLDVIQFNSSDTLYILGDIIDRGPENLKMIKKVMETPNIEMIIGNHEDMMVNFYKYKSPYDYIMWYENGGGMTDIEFMKLDEEEQNKILKFFNDLPFEKEIDVNGQKFLLVHGNYVSPFFKSQYKPSAYRNMVIWNRMESIDRGPDDKIVILGHTPTNHFSTEKPYKIYHQGNIINIDCGMARYAFGDENAQLACLCLDNLKEYYV